jgi:hypothetical protein
VSGGGRCANREATGDGAFAGPNRNALRSGALNGATAQGQIGPGAGLVAGRGRNKPTPWSSCKPRELRYSAGAVKGVPQRGASNAPPGALHFTVALGTRFRVCARGGVPAPQWRRRSLKTQQHALRQTMCRLLEVLCPTCHTSVRRGGRSQRSSSTPSTARGGLCVLAHRNRASTLCVKYTLHGEFDPGSGRTLAACLTHASGATNRGLPRGKAANG